MSEVLEGLQSDQWIQYRLEKNLAEDVSQSKYLYISIQHQSTTSNTVLDLRFENTDQSVRWITELKANLEEVQSIRKSFLTDHTR